MTLTLESGLSIKQSPLGCYPEEQLSPIWPTTSLRESKVAATSGIPEE